MKKTYIIPQITVEVLESEKMLAASMFDINNESTQSITPTDEEYDEEFCVKGYSFGESIFDE